MQHANDKVVHVTLYVGAFEVCSELYDALEIKSMQIDTLG